MAEKNALRFTPSFDISSEEVDLIIKVARDTLINGPMKETATVVGTSSEAA